MKKFFVSFFLLMAVMFQSQGQVSRINSYDAGNPIQVKVDTGYSYRFDSLNVTGNVIPVGSVVSGNFTFRVDSGIYVYPSLTGPGSTNNYVLDTVSGFNWNLNYGIYAKILTGGTFYVEWSCTRTGDTTGVFSAKLYSNYLSSFQTFTWRYIATKATCFWKVGGVINWYYLYSSAFTQGTSGASPIKRSHNAYFLWRLVNFTNFYNLN